MKVDYLRNKRALNLPFFAAAACIVSHPPIFLLPFLFLFFHLLSLPLRSLGFSLRFPERIVAGNRKPSSCGSSPRHCRLFTSLELSDHLIFFVCLRDCVESCTLPCLCPPGRALFNDCRALVGLEPFVTPPARRIHALDLVTAITVRTFCHRTSPPAFMTVVPKLEVVAPAPTLPVSSSRRLFVF
eukprot:30957-Pelagococcus_subviridis.AAC.5